ncbi:MAG: hypothetical protein LBP75_07190 [Planctomycetota bacterium]|jgi:hypothetical protein|nr:hypothetical protein [Planctomycetota bacterium]
MSNRERCLSLIKSFSEEQLAAITRMLESVAVLTAEADDDAFCRRLYRDYQNDDRGEPARRRLLERENYA